jgi:hypothetical protein
MKQGTHLVLLHTTRLAVQQQLLCSLTDYLPVLLLQETRLHLQLQTRTRTHLLQLLQNDLSHIPTTFSNSSNLLSRQ